MATIPPVADPNNAAYDPTDPSYAIYESGLSAYNNVQDLQSQLDQMKQKILLVSAMMTTVSPMIACEYMIPLMMEMLGQAQSIQQVAIPSAQLDEQSAMLQEVTLQQSLFNQLGAGAQGYNNYTCEQNDSSNSDYYKKNSNGQVIYDENGNPEYDPTLDPNYVQGVPPMTDTEAAQYEATMTEFNNCTATIISVLDTSLNTETDPVTGAPAPGAGWLDAGTATTMQSNEEAISDIMKPTDANGNPLTIEEQSQNFAHQYSCYVANPTNPTNPNGDPVQYDSNGTIVDGSPLPDPYPVAQNVQILTQSMNTNVSMMNSCSQTTTGKIKAGTSEVQQFYSQTEDAMQSQKQLKQTEVNALAAGS